MRRATRPDSQQKEKIMRATITTPNNETVIQGKTLTDIRIQMNAMLEVSSPRGLTATTETGAEIHVELYENQDYIRLANGRIIK